MKINTVLTEVDVGASNIAVEGKIVYEDPPEHKVGDSKKTKRPYDFWSQWIVIEDETGSIGCSVSIEKEEYRLEKEVIARIKGKLKEWPEGSGKKSISGKLLGISRGDKVTDVQQEVAEEFFEEKAAVEKKMVIKNKVAKEFFEDNAKNAIGKQMYDKAEKEKISVDKWEAKDLRIARECAIKAVTELVCAKIMKSKDFFNFADALVKYIYNGNNNGKEKKSILRDDRQPLKVIDEDEPFPGEPSKKELNEVERAVNEKEGKPGSSIDNALPFKGKKKKLKKVSKAEEFVTADDMPD